MKKILTVCLVIILFTATIPASANAKSPEEVQDEFIDNLTAPLRPGELLEVAMNGNFYYEGVLSSYGYNDVADVYLFQPNDRRYTEEFRQWDFIIIGDLIEFADAVLTYSDGTVVKATHRVYTDGEHVTFRLDPTKTDLYAEIFVSVKVVVEGTSETYLAIFTYSDEGSGYGFGYDPIRHIGSQYPEWLSPYSSTRSGGTGSVYEIVRVVPDELWPGWFPDVYAVTWPIIPAGSIPNEPAPPDLDVPTPSDNPPSAEPSPWAAGQVNAAIGEGFVPQTLQSAYNQATTRAEFCALAAALYEKYTGAEIKGRSAFADTDDINVQKMASVGVVSGTDAARNLFSPDADLTREQAATMLARLADAIGEPLPKQTAAFADSADISTWATEAVGQVQAAGIMGGVGNDRFAPKDPYTREQSIATIMRLWDIVKA